MKKIIDQIVMLVFKLYRTKINNDTKIVNDKDKFNKAKRVKILKEIFLYCGRSKRVMCFFIREQKLITPHLKTIEILLLVLIKLKTNKLNIPGYTVVLDEYVEVTPELRNMFKDYQDYPGLSGVDVEHHSTTTVYSKERNQMITLESISLDYDSEIES